MPPLASASAEFPFSARSLLLGVLMARMASSSALSSTLTLYAVPLWLDCGDLLPCAAPLATCRSQGRIVIFFSTEGPLETHGQIRPIRRACNSV